jgi:hypothetical protein
MKLLTKGGVVLVLALVPTASAGVRVAHLSPDTPAVNVRFGAAGGALSEIITGLEYPGFAPGAVASYLPVPTGSYDIRVDAPSLGAAGTGAISVDGVALDGNTFYTVAAVGTLSSLLTPNPLVRPLQPLLLVDDNTIDPAAARLRFVHASADTPAVDIVAVLAGGTRLQLFDGVATLTSGGYVTVPAGTYTIEAYLDSGTGFTGSPALTVPGVSVDIGTVYSAYAIGLSGLGQNPGPGQDLRVALSVDAIPEPGMLGWLAPAGALLVRRRR